ncbi:hypothetical protein ACFSC4_16665 [Deinococcus malanensis]|uniref:AAA family ATPase n=1 Tax=Deinococcus malanensis TaxID=1706855 RepID=UPI0036415BEC
METRHAALRLTPDEWMLPLFGAGEFQGKRAVLEHDLLWSVARRALVLGVSVVLDYGVWSREEREMYRLRACGLGWPPCFMSWTCRWMTFGCGFRPATRTCRQGRSRSREPNWSNGAAGSSGRPRRNGRCSVPLTPCRALAFRAPACTGRLRAGLRAR